MSSGICGTTAFRIMSVLSTDLDSPSSIPRSAVSVFSQPPFHAMDCSTRPIRPNAPTHGFSRGCSSRWGSVSIQILSLPCGAPTARAGMQCHSASCPISAKAPNTSGAPRTSIPATFSSRILGCPTMRTARRIYQNSPERSPASPAPFPANDMSWHGKPAVTRPTGPRAEKSAVVTSSYCGTPGQCLPRTLRAYGLISQNATVWKSPARSSPRLKPPAPANKSRTFNSTSPATPAQSLPAPQS